jgi:hypothetical protein
MMSKNRILTILFLSFSFVANLQSAEAKINNSLVHNVGLNIGSTTIFNDYTTFHIGLNYELKKFNGTNGIGFFSDFQFGPHFELLLGFPFYFHHLYNSDFYLMAAPGIGFISSLKYARYTSAEPDDFTGASNRANLLMRFGTGYEIPIISQEKEIMKISPYINVDVIAQYMTYMSIGITAFYYIY